MAPPVSDVQQISAPIETSEALEYRELLAEVRLKDKHKPQIDGWLQEFQIVVMAIKNDKKCCDLTDQLWLKSAKVPIIQEPFPVSGDHHFQTPSVCHIIGGYALGTSLGAPEVLIDMAIEMPAKCWQRQDCLNHRYHRKRALYLCHILQSLKTSPLIGSAKFQYINGHHMRPVVVIAPSDQRLAKRFRVSLTAYPESDGKAFRWIRFIPEKNNIRSNWWQPMTGQTADGDSDGDDSQEVPTPVYNASIQHDLNLVSNHEVVAEAVKQWAPLRDSLILLKVWLKQRRLDREFGFCLSLFVCHLLKSRKISDKSGYYHMFRNTLLSICE
jgi:U3 small nucleolar RNA-associated protein 22